MNEQLEEKLNLDEFLGVKAQDVVDVVFVSGEGKELAAQERDAIAFNVANETSNETYEVDFDYIINAVVSSMTNVAKLPTKKSTFIEPNEIEAIKKSLNSYSADCEAIDEFRLALTIFQEKIQIEYAQKIKLYNDERIVFEAQIDSLEAAKRKIVNKRLSQMLWPFDEQTRKYDSQIDSLKIRAGRCAQKANAIMAMRPAANEKDLLVFKAQLKQKFVE